MEPVKRSSFSESATRNVLGPALLHCTLSLVKEPEGAPCDPTPRLKTSEIPSCVPSAFRK